MCRFFGRCCSLCVIRCSCLVPSRHGCGSAYPGHWPVAARSVRGADPWRPPGRAERGVAFWSAPVHESLATFAVTSLRQLIPFIPLKHT